MIMNRWRVLKLEKLYSAHSMSNSRVRDVRVLTLEMLLCSASH